MPKKTKKQKMAAEKRKSEHSYEPQVTVFNSTQIEKKEIKEDVKMHQKVSSSVPSASTEIFKKELTKSLAISALIILVEIGIYLAQNNVIPVTNFL